MQKTASQISDEVLFKLAASGKEMSIVSKVKGLLGKKKPDYVTQEQLQHSWDNKTNELAKMQKKSAYQPSQEDLDALSNQFVDAQSSGIGPAGGMLGGALLGAGLGVPAGSPILSRIGAGALGAAVGGAGGRMLDRGVADIKQVNSPAVGGFTPENAPALGRILGGIGGTALGAILSRGNPNLVQRLVPSVGGGLMGSALGGGIGAGVEHLTSGN